MRSDASECRFRCGHQPVAIGCGVPGHIDTWDETAAARNSTTLEYAVSYLRAGAGDHGNRQRRKEETSEPRAQQRPCHSAVSHQPARHSSAQALHRRFHADFPECLEEPWTWPAGGLLEKRAPQTLALALEVLGHPVYTSTAHLHAC